MIIEEGCLRPNGIGFPPGPYCRRRLRDKTLKKTTVWNGKMVRRFYKNRLLGGAHAGHLGLNEVLPASTTCHLFGAVEAIGTRPEAFEPDTFIL